MIIASKAFKTWFDLCEDTFCYGAITKLIIAMSKAEPESACMVAKVLTFIASFMRMVDLKLGHFLHSCANAETIADVDFEALNFEADIRDVAFQRVTTVLLRPWWLNSLRQ